MEISMNTKRLPAHTMFKLILLASIIIRLYLAICTEGTTDIIIWHKHAEQISKIGLSE